MVIDSNLATVGAAYGSSTIIGTLLHLYNGMREWRESQAERRHELDLIGYTKSYEDVQKARDAVPDRDKTEGFWGGSFIGWTRRLLAWLVIIFGIAFVAGELGHYPVNLVYEVPKSFLGWHWTSYIIKTVQGVVISPYMREYCNIVLGFYMGHFTVKSFKKS